MASPFNNTVLPHQQLIADKHQAFINNGPSSTMPIKNNDVTGKDDVASNSKSNADQPAIKRVDLIDLSNWIKADGLDVVNIRLFHHSHKCPLQLPFIDYIVSSCTIFCLVE